MPATCKACRHFDAPSERGVYLCRGCTQLLLKILANPALGLARVIRARSYALACEVCGEHENRRIVNHPEWGRVCEVDVREAADIHRLS